LDFSYFFFRSYGFRQSGTSYEKKNRALPLKPLCLPAGHSRKSPLTLNNFTFKKVRELDFYSLTFFVEKF
jgi:hypothetical protein